MEILFQTELLSLHPNLPVFEKMSKVFSQ